MQKKKKKEKQRATLQEMMCKTT